MNILIWIIQYSRRLSQCAVELCFNVNCKLWKATSRLSTHHNIPATLFSVTSAELCPSPPADASPRHPPSPCSAPPTAALSWSELVSEHFAVFVVHGDIYSGKSPNPLPGVVSSSGMCLLLCLSVRKQLHGASALAPVQFPCRPDVNV